MWLVDVFDVGNGSDVAGVSGVVGVSDVVYGLELVYVLEAGKKRKEKRREEKEASTSAIMNARITRVTGTFHEKQTHSDLPQVLVSGPGENDDTQMTFLPGC